MRIAMVLSKFDALSVRPPTPPKDQEDTGVDETLQFLEDPFGEQPVAPKIKVVKAPNTPEKSPSSDIDVPSSAASARKRVNFELQTCGNITNKSLTHSWTPTRSSPLRPLPQTRLTKPLKSILKPSDGTPTPPPADDAVAAHKFKSFAEMLESIVKLLASSERSSRMDAYKSLERTMQAYDKIPDEQALKQKMSLLTQFIRRDSQAPSMTGTGLDSQLVGQAMKLLMALFRIPDLLSTMDDDFCSFIIERIIRMASDSTIPKAVVNVHLAVLMQQNFRPKIVTVARVEKALDALDTIHERVSGNAVQAYRIRIYRKFIQQRPDVMIKYTERWFTYTLKALVSTSKDIGQSALDTTVTAAKSIGHDRNVARSVLAVLNRTKSDGGTIAGVFAKELVRMLDDDHAVSVPQIWAAVTGLLKDSLNGDMFTAMKEWLEVFQSCISSEKEQVRVHSNVAFCFLLYSVNLGPNTTEAWSKMFLSIALHALQRSTSAKKPERAPISSSYFTLLYYGLRPTASFAQLDRYWNEFVASVWNPLIHSAPGQHAIPACRLVSALLDGSRKPWNECRALDLRPQYMIQRSELPLVDPRWVRKSIARVLRFVETLLDATLLTETKDPEDEPVKAMWLSLISSLVEASSKEIMASTETKDAMAQIVNLLRRIWDRHTAKLAVPQKKEDIWADKFCFLIETVIQKMGPFQFADKSLSRNDKNEFEVASTPSHRSRSHGTRTSPLLYLVDLLVTQSEGKLADPVRLRVMEVIIQPCFTAQNTRLGKLELLRDCATTVGGSLKGAVSSSFWAQISSLLNATLKESVVASNERVVGPLGKEYETVVEVLGLGADSLMNKPCGYEVLSTLIDTARREAGEGALILGVIEKVSEFVMKRVPEEEQSSCLTYASILLRNLPKQMSRKLLDQGRQNLWPSNQSTGRNADFDPYIHLYGAVAAVSAAAYRDLDRDDVESRKDFLSALVTSIQHCPTSQLAVYLRKTQDWIAVWIEDPEEKMQSRDEPLKSLHREVVRMWQEVSKAIERLPRRDSQTLLHLETLITAGFVSRRRSIVNISIETWNNTFGKEENLQYPTNLEQALRRLRSSVDLSLPSLEVRKDDAMHQPSFYESDTSTDDMKRPFKSPRVKDSPFKISKSTRRSASRSPAVPKSASRRAPARGTPKARLRHDNSQIQFEPIVSSPSNPFDQESQLLTERQKEMIDRQKHSTDLFANTGALSPQPDEVPLPMEVDSDALTADDLPGHGVPATPLRALTAVGPMDAYLGSSPTPHTRKSIQNIVSEDTDVATPTAVRSIQYTANGEPRSSPPGFRKTTQLEADTNNSVVLVGSSFEYRQPESTFSTSFDEGTTIDEEALLEAIAYHENPQADTDLAMNSTISEVPSSAIDLEVTAQIDAEMQTHDEPATDGTEVAASESQNDFVDAASHQQPSIRDGDRAGSYAGVENTRTPTRASARRTSRKSSQAGTSSTNKVDDSFVVSSQDTPNSLRRSTRHSTGIPPLPPSTKKPRHPPGRKESKAQNAQAEVQDEKSQKQDSVEPNGANVLDSIAVAASSTPKKARGKKRKSMSSSAMPDPDVATPQSNCKMNLRRSHSTLNQVENSQDMVDETPAPKRARRDDHQDVSEAKEEIPSSQTKRLSHIQVSPRPRSRSSNQTSPTADHSIEISMDHSTTDTTVDTTVAIIQPQPSSSLEPGPEPSHHLTRSSSQQAAQLKTPSRSFAERVILTPRSIINQLKSLKDYIFSTPQLVFSREEEREVSDAVFHIQRGVFTAGLKAGGELEYESSERRLEQ
ncbi:Rap1-interacting factor 1 N terminal-domain-containing protein [Bipolaris maydis]|nr:Rap1-interacting factor 1 N terminal-domain-containing protein [Bipolaris maydis]